MSRKLTLQDRVRAFRILDYPKGGITTETKRVEQIRNFEPSNQTKSVETIHKNGQLLRGHFAIKSLISLIYQEDQTLCFMPWNGQETAITLDKMKRVFTRQNPLVFTLH